MARGWGRGVSGAPQCDTTPRQRRGIRPRFSHWLHTFGDAGLQLCTGVCCQSRSVKLAECVRLAGGPGLILRMRESRGWCVKLLWATLLATQADSEHTGSYLEIISPEVRVMTFPSLSLRSLSPSPLSLASLPPSLPLPLPLPTLFLHAVSTDHPPPLPLLTRLTASAILTLPPPLSLPSTPFQLVAPPPPLPLCLSV